MGFLLKQYIFFMNSERIEYDNTYILSTSIVFLFTLNKTEISVQWAGLSQKDISGSGRKITEEPIE